MMQLLIKTEFNEVIRQYLNEDTLGFDLSDLLLKLNKYNTFPFYYVQTTVDEKNLETIKYRIDVSL